MARRDLTGAVDFTFLEQYAAGDSNMVDEVLAIFREQADLWRAMLDESSPGWRDALHTLKGAARGIGAAALGDACEHAEEAGGGALPAVHTALDLVLFDIAAYQHEQALRSLKG